MSSSASTDTFPDDMLRVADAVPVASAPVDCAAWASRLAADVAETRRASGITIAPEAALHRALQERTDELERVRESARAESLMLRRRVSEMEDENEDNRRRRAQAVETMECREAEREVIEAGLRQQIYTLTRERDEARASLAEAQVDPLMRTLQQVRRERDEARAEVARWEAESREGYDLLAQIAPPTAPDVGSTTSAPAAGAADPPRPRLMKPHPSERVIAWSRTVFGEGP